MQRLPLALEMGLMLGITDVQEGVADMVGVGAAGVSWDFSVGSLGI